MDSALKKYVSYLLAHVGAVSSIVAEYILLPKNARFHLIPDRKECAMLIQRRFNKRNRKVLYEFLSLNRDDCPDFDHLQDLDLINYLTSHPNRRSFAVQICKKLNLRRIVYVELNRPNNRWAQVSRSWLVKESSPVCSNCESRDIQPILPIDQGISCVGCGESLCRTCFAASVHILGTVGDVNNLIPVELHHETRTVYERVFYVMITQDLMTLVELEHKFLDDGHLAFYLS
jgi:hypothetical protein